MNNAKICFSSPFLVVLLLLTAITAFSQTTFVPRNSMSHKIVSRFEIMSGISSKGDASALSPLSRLYIAGLTDSLSKLDQVNLSRVDRANIDWLKADNLPYSASKEAMSRRKLPFGFYSTKANFYRVNDKEFQLLVNPGFNFQVGKISHDGNLLYTNTRAVEIRGTINNRLGFYSSISENQLRPAPQEREYFNKFSALPGAHLVKGFKSDGLDFFKASGYITFRLLPAISVQFGQSTNFIGHGKRSLLLSDFATDYLFVKVNTQVWKLNYQNLYAKLIDRHGAYVRPWPAKYMVAHYLGIDLFRNFNLGFYESAVFHDNRSSGRGFDLYYLNPVIFYRSVEHLLGDADKMMVGLNSSWLPWKNIKLYGQLMVNEFRLKDLMAGEGHAANKFGYQLGLNYVNLAGINNVDMEVEYNRVRPYSYAHYTMPDETHPVNSYSHYNQPLAHPLGANFSELLVTLSAQPAARLTMELNLISAIYGADSLNSNWGGNILLDYGTAMQELGNHVGQGVRTNLSIAEFITSWQVRHNLFLDLELKYRHLDSELNERDTEHIYFGTALRLNLERRRWEY